jgi:hypothetical protein
METEKSFTEAQKSFRVGPGTFGVASVGIMAGRGGREPRWATPLTGDAATVGVGKRCGYSQTRIAKQAKACGQGIDAACKIY